MLFGITIHPFIGLVNADSAQQWQHRVQIGFVSGYQTCVPWMKFLMVVKSLVVWFSSLSGKYNFVVFIDRNPQFVG